MKQYIVLLYSYHFTWGLIRVIYHVGGGGGGISTELFYAERPIFRQRFPVKHCADCGRSLNMAGK